MGIVCNGRIFWGVGIDADIIKSSIEAPIRIQFLMRLIGYIFHQITDFFPHLLRQIDSMTLLQDVIDAAFTGLTVNAPCLETENEPVM